MPIARPSSQARRTLNTVAAVALLAMATSAWSQSTAASASDRLRVGTVKQVKGDVRLGLGNQSGAPSAGDAVTEGDRISTGKDGSASLILRDGTTIALGPNSSAQITQFQFDATTQQGNVLVELLQGSARFITGLLAKVNPERFKVKTPTAIVGVRGTDFIVEASQQ